MRSLPLYGSAQPNAGSSATSALLDFAKANFSSLVAMHKIALELSRRQNEIVAGIAKQWMGVSSPAAAAIDIVGRSVDTIIQIQQHFLDLYTPTHGEASAHSTFAPALPDAAQTQALSTRTQ